MKFGLGHIRDSYDSRDFESQHLLGSLTQDKITLPLKADALVHKIKRIRNQGQTSSCVGNALASAIEARLSLIEAIPPHFSSAAIYSLARRLEMGNKGQLIDRGCYPRVAMKVIKKYGLLPNSMFPLKEETINREVTLEEMQVMSKARVFSWYRINEFEGKRVQRVMQAIAKNHPVVFGTQVTNKWWDYGKHRLNELIYPKAKGDEDLGGHMTALLGYEYRDGKPVFIGLNSYGEHNWGYNGFYFASTDLIESYYSFDFYVLEVF